MSVRLLLFRGLLAYCLDLANRSGDDAVVFINHSSCQKFWPTDFEATLWFIVILFFLNFRNI